MNVWYGRKYGKSCTNSSFCMMNVDIINTASMMSVMSSEKSILNKANRRCIKSKESGKGNQYGKKIYMKRSLYQRS